MNVLKDIFLQKYNISSDSFALLSSYMKEVKKSKGELLVTEGEVQHYIYFIVSGAMRSYYVNNDGKEVTYWFGFEGDIVASLGSFINSKPSIENIEVLENSVILAISRSNLLKLFDTNIELSNFGRKITEQALLEMEEQILMTQFTDAKSRYIKLINKFPQILQRVKLGHISSYLGITQVTLSRIRSKM